MRLSIHPKTQWSTRIGWNGTRSPTTPVDLRPFLNRSSCFELGIIRALQLLSDIFYSIRLSVILCNFTAMPRIFLWNQHHCRQRYRSFQFVKFRDWQSECRHNHLCCLSQVEHVRWWFDDLILARNSAFCSNISRPLGRYVFWGAIAHFLYRLSFGVQCFVLTDVRLWSSSPLYRLLVFSANLKLSGSHLIPLHRHLAPPVTARIFRALHYQ